MLLWLRWLGEEVRSSMGIDQGRGLAWFGENGAVFIAISGMTELMWRLWLGSEVGQGDGSGFRREQRFIQSDKISISSDGQ